MNMEVVEKIARAVLYEGYILFPYRPSAIKNQQRFNFGVLYPQPYCELQNGTDASSMRTECLIEGSSATTLRLRVRFLQLVARTVGELTTSVADLQPGQGPAFRLLEKLEVEGQVWQPWEEAEERTVEIPPYRVEALAGQPLEWRFQFPADRRFELVYDSQGKASGVIVRTHDSLSGVISIRAESVSDGVFKVVVEVSNSSPLEHAEEKSRNQALLRSLVSAHSVLGVSGGSLVSLLEPPELLREMAAACRNVGTYPVLVGEPPQRDTMLSSPIILYDYPQIAPESAGDLFDSTEIDEILSLRILTMTDKEKLEMRHADERARRILERTETLPAEHWMKLHGALRGLRPADQEKATER